MEEAEEAKKRKFRLRNVIIVNYERLAFLKGLGIEGREVIVAATTDLLGKTIVVPPDIHIPYASPLKQFTMKTITP